MNNGSLWELKTLREITLPTTTWNPQAEPKSIKYVDVSAISRQNLSIESYAEHDADSAPSRARKIMREGDTIFATVRPALKRIARVPVALDNEISSTAFCILRPNRTLVDPEFLFFAVSAQTFVDRVVACQTGASYPAVRDRDVFDQMIPLPPLEVQKEIASALNAVRSLLLHQDSMLSTANEIKAGAMRDLFSGSLESAHRTETDLGPLPESWNVERLDKIASVVSTRMSLTDLEHAREVNEGETQRVLGVKVSDMNLPGNEVFVKRTAVEKVLPKATVEQRCAPPGTIIFPKRGAAIATNKKRLSADWTVFDPNVIGVVPGPRVHAGFLFQWFQSFDLSTITEPGPTPQINKKHLEPLLVPVPPQAEQEKISAILEALDSKADLHKRKQTLLDELFSALLTGMMAGAISTADIDMTALGLHALAHGTAV